MTLKKVAYAALTVSDMAPVKLWGHAQSEHLTHTDLDSAIQDFLEFREDLTVTAEHEPTVTFMGFVPMSLGSPRADAERLLEHLVESWDEDFGDPDGDWMRPKDFSPGVLDAGTAFVEAVRSEYRVWAHESIIEVEVPVLEWVRQHAPEWLEKKVTP